MSDLKIDKNTRALWRSVCKPDGNDDSNVTMRGINKILDDVESLETDNATLKTLVDQAVANLTNAKAQVDEDAILETKTVRINHDSRKP